MKNSNNKAKNINRLYLLDTIRGLAIIGMIFIHVSYDLPVYFNFIPQYLYSTWYEVFSQCVRITFIFLSGYCAMMGAKTLKRGLIVSAAGLLVTLVSFIAGVDPPIIFGVLTLIGASMLLSVPFKKIINKKNALPVFIVCLLLFVCTLHLCSGYFGFVWHSFFYYPPALFRIRNPYLLYPLAFLGIPGYSFASSDYFPLIPWFFLFMAGFSFYALCGESLKEKKFMRLRIEPLAFLGKYSLYVYLIHQPLILGIMYLIAFLMLLFSTP